ncbi:hypothetical protein LT493_04925 [Streptomyces tricolor]|nr:hypothetical protein [Streptomyces tricolor]
MATRSPAAAAAEAEWEAEELRAAPRGQVLQGRRARRGRPDDPGHPHRPAVVLAGQHRRPLMRWDIAGSFAAYAVPAALLAVAFVIKLPLLRRAWQDPIPWATALLLGIGAIVFASLPPANLHRINVLSGIPNFAGLWVYSLLTAYCGACLWLIITWREPPSAVRRRRTRLVWVAYTVIIVGLWTTFLLGDHHVERIRDLDTYYADTPWMREFVLLYLVAHLVSALVAAGMLWAWYREVEDASAAPGGDLPPGGLRPRARLRRRQARRDRRSVERPGLGLAVDVRRPAVRHHGGRPGGCRLPRRAGRAVGGGAPAAGAHPPAPEAAVADHADRQRAGGARDRPGQRCRAPPGAAPGRHQRRAAQAGPVPVRGPAPADPAGGGRGGPPGVRRPGHRGGGGTSSSRPTRCTHPRTTSARCPPDTPGSPASPDSELESVAHALRYHAAAVERFRRQTVAAEGPGSPAPS